MKNKSFDVSLVAFLGFFILSAGLFTVFSTGNVKSVYKDISAVLPSGGSQLAAASVDTVDVMGWAWSSNIGWISFNSANPTSQGGGPYKVIATKNSATQATFSGYAWSPNVGWISFNASDVSGCPTGACTPTIALTSGGVNGWARILSMRTENAANGWLQLSGANHTTLGASPPNDGVQYNRTSGAITGKAWESTAIGWTDFNASAPGLTTTSVAALGGTCTTPLTSVPSGTDVTFTANPTGGTSPYSYKWNSLSYDPLATTFSQTYSTAGDGPDLSIRDNMGTTYSTAQCPDITISSGGGTSGLFIGSTVATIKTSHTVRQGTNFVVRWAQTLDPSLNVCSIGILPNDGGNWQTPIDNGLAVSITAGSATGLTTTNVPRGTYSFSFSCTNADQSQTSAPAIATLRVISASGEEF